MRPRAIRVLVADDSPTARSFLAAILRSDPALDVVGEARDGAEVVELARAHRPDVITMDVHMPRLSGLEATRRIMEEVPTRVVIVSATSATRDTQWALEALRLGALAVVPKPSSPHRPEFVGETQHLLSTVKAMAGVAVVRQRFTSPAPAPVAPLPPATRRAQPAELVAIAASTGGTRALHEILSALPGDFPVPIVVVQHIAGPFVNGFAVWLNDACRLAVKIAEHGERLRPATVFVAPDDRHLGVLGRRVALSDDPPVGGFRPSGTYLFQSVGEAFGAATAALILTGMGRDGVDGLRVVKRAGGTIVAQDEATSVVNGMPGAAVAEGLADFVLPLSRIAPRLLELVC